MIKSKLRTRERLADTLALKAPLRCEGRAHAQVFPLVGDGCLASSVTRPLRGGADSYLGRDARGRWRQVLINRGTEGHTRAQLVEARYRDWLAARDARRIAA